MALEAADAETALLSWFDIYRGDSGEGAGDTMKKQAKKLEKKEKDKQAKARQNNGRRTQKTRSRGR